MFGQDTQEIVVLVKGLFYSLGKEPTLSSCFSQFGFVFLCSHAVLIGC